MERNYNSAAWFIRDRFDEILMCNKSSHVDQIMRKIPTIGVSGHVWGSNPAENVKGLQAMFVRIFDLNLKRLVGNVARKNDVYRAIYRLNSKFLGFDTVWTMIDVIETQSAAKNVRMKQLKEFKSVVRSEFLRQSNDRVAIPFNQIWYSRTMEQMEDVIAGIPQFEHADLIPRITRNIKVAFRVVFGKDSNLLRLCGNSNLQNIIFEAVHCLNNKIPKMHASNLLRRLIQNKPQERKHWRDLDLEFERFLLLCQLRENDTVAIHRILNHIKKSADPLHSLLPDVLEQDKTLQLCISKMPMVAGRSSDAVKRVLLRVLREQIMQTVRNEHRVDDLSRISTITGRQQIERERIYFAIRQWRNNFKSFDIWTETLALVQDLDRQYNVGKEDCECSPMEQNVNLWLQLQQLDDLYRP